MSLSYGHQKKKFHNSRLKCLLQMFWANYNTAGCKVKAFVSMPRILHEKMLEIQAFSQNDFEYETKV